MGVFITCQVDGRSEENVHRDKRQVMRDEAAFLCAKETHIFLDTFFAL